MQISTQPREKRETGQTYGEYLFDAAVYLGLGYVANAAISVAVTHQAQNIPGSTLSKTMKSAEKYWRDGVKLLTSDQAAIDKWAPYMNRMLFLSSGGYILLLPTKWLEDNKKAIVEKMDSLFDTGPKTPAQQKLFDDYYDNQPKQSYLTLFGGRIAAHPLIVSAAVPIMISLKGTEHVGNFLEKYCAPLFKNMKHPKEVISLTSEEIILSFTATALTYGISKTLAHALHKPKKQDKGTIQPDTQPATDSQEQLVAELKKAGVDLVERPPVKVNSSEVAGVAVAPLQPEISPKPVAASNDIEHDLAVIEKANAPDNQVTAAQHLHAIAPANQAQAHISS